jgi:hypothetical protein
MPKLSYKNYNTKDNFCKELEHVFSKFLKYLRNSGMMVYMKLVIILELE